MFLISISFSKFPKKIIIDASKEKKIKIETGKEKKMQIARRRMSHFYF
jgi:hypothetical protein